MNYNDYEIKAQKRNKSSILLIYTGGTIGMKQDPVDFSLKPFDFSQILEEVPELNKYAFKVDSYTFDPLIDSSDIEISHWQSLARIIQQNYEKYDGFVVLHGTDTMAYSASALSFMLDNLSKSVIFTGSQLPIGQPRTDGKENLISAVEIASAKEYVEGVARAKVPEVCIYFNSKLLRGNRAIKVNSEEFAAFTSPNFPPLAEAGINIKYNKTFIMQPKTLSGTLNIYTKLDTRVSILKMYPGITSEIVSATLFSEQTRAIILETYGAGNAPSKKWFLDLIKKAISMGKLIINSTQCLYGSVNMDIYDTGKNLKNEGVISGNDCTVESLLTKLFYLMGMSQDNEWIKDMMNKNLKEEMTVI